MKKTTIAVMISITALSGGLVGVLVHSGQRVHRTGESADGGRPLPQINRSDAPGLTALDASELSAETDGSGVVNSDQVFVPASTYTRNLDSLLKKDRVDIHLSAYYIDQDEVTRTDYQKCVRSGRCKNTSVEGQDDWPVAGVSWEDARDYCAFIGRRLPSEAEWERVAFPSENSDGHGPMISPKYDLCISLAIGGIDGKHCEQNRESPVTISVKNSDARLAYYPDRSEIGDKIVFDLFGNVAEWVADWDSPKLDYFKPPIKTDPRGPTSGDLKVIRGGSYASTTGISESDRRIAPPMARFPDVGFRCASDAR